MSPDPDPVPAGPPPGDLSPGGDPPAIEAIASPSTAFAETLTASLEPVAAVPEPLPQYGPPPLTESQRYLVRRDQIEREFLDVKRVCVFYAAMLVPLLIFTGWCYHTKAADTLTAELWLGGLLYLLITGFAWSWRDSLRGRFAWPRDAGRVVWAAVVVTPALTITSVCLSFHLMKNWGWPIADPLLEPMLGAGWPAILIYMWIAVMPACFEEIAFRGLVLGKLQRVMTPLQALWVTAILFGILHFTVLSLAVFLVPLALVAGRLTQRTGSLWPAMLIHFLHNAGIVTLELLR